MQPRQFFINKRSDMTALAKGWNRTLVRRFREHKARVSRLRSRFDDIILGLCGAPFSPLFAHAMALGTQADGIGVPTTWFNEVKSRLDALDGEETTVVNIRDPAYGGTGLGVEDEVAAWNAAVADLNAGEILYLPEGQYRFASKPDRIPFGAYLRGDVSSSTSRVGTTLIADYDEATATSGFIEFDGSDASGAVGTGVMVGGVTLAKATGKTGGTALRFTGSADANRVTFAHIQKVIIVKQGTGSWSHCWRVDGTGLNTAGSQGIRDITIDSLFCSGAETANETVVLHNAIHVLGSAFYVFAGGTSATPGITITGDAVANGKSTNIILSSFQTDGNVVIDYAEHVFLYGRIGGDLTTTANTGVGAVFGNVQGTPTLVGDEFRVETIASEYRYHDSGDLETFYRFITSGRHRTKWTDSVGADMFVVDVYGNTHPSKPAIVTWNANRTGSVYEWQIEGINRARLKRDLFEVLALGPIRLPKMSTTFRDALTDVANGDIIYNTTTNRFNGYQNGAWINLDDGTAA